MSEIDLSKVKKKRPKIPVSLSLDKANIDFLKKELENHKGATLSGVFDHWLGEFVSDGISEKEKGK